MSTQQTQQTSRTNHPTPTRNAWAIVAKREMLSKLKDRSFILSTVLMVVIIGGFLGVQSFLDGRTKDYTIVATQTDAAFTRTVADAVSRTDDKVKVTVTDADSPEAAKAKVLEDTADVWMHKDGDDWVMTARNEVPSGLQTAASTVVRETVVAENAAQAGTTMAAIDKGSVLKASILKGDADKQGFAKVMGFVLAFLFYMASIGFGMQLAGSVVEEKASRIVEIIATKIPVRQLLIGKVLGNTALAVGQMVLYTGLGLAGLAFTSYKSYLPSVSAGVGWFLAFFLVGFLVIACAWAVAGALASRTEDLQQTAMPLTMLMMAMWFSVFLAKGAALTVLSFVPPFSAILMPIRILEGTAAWWEPVIALLLLVALAAAIVRGAERLYRRSLLQTQGKLSLKQAWSAPE